ncbi:MAG: hemerythrin family protein [Fibrobacter sp.]|nr:hemerythrin family protein [Fibrobacter sp.]
MAIEWNDELSVKVESLDAEHKTLIETINTLGSAMKARKSNQVIGEVIEKLIGYAGTHFAHEEDLFDKYSFPASINHKREHNDFVRKVTAFKKDFDSGKLMLSIEILEFLTAWLKNHIQKEDKGYSELFIKNNVK